MFIAFGTSTEVADTAARAIAAGPWLMLVAAGTSTAVADTAARATAAGPWLMLVAAGTMTEVAGTAASATAAGDGRTSRSILVGATPATAIAAAWAETLRTSETVGACGAKATVAGAATTIVRAMLDAPNADRATAAGPWLMFTGSGTSTAVAGTAASAMAAGPWLIVVGVGTLTEVAGTADRATVTGLWLMFVGVETTMPVAATGDNATATGSMLKTRDAHGVSRLRLCLYVIVLVLPEVCSTRVITTSFWVADTATLDDVVNDIV